MFHYICKALLKSRNGYTFRPHHNPSMAASLTLMRYFSSDANNPHSLTVSYLTQTCGLSLESALSASKSVRFESPDQPDSVLSSFQKFGFSKTNISEIIRKRPRVLCSHPEKIISAKLEFFRSKGISTPELVHIFTVNPWILKASLENQLVRNFDALVEMFQSEVKAIELIKKNPYVLGRNKVHWIPNFNTLKQNGVSSSNILWLLCNHWMFINICSVKFGKVVEELKEMGFNPMKSQFCVAIVVLLGIPKLKWNGRVEVYKRYGWSDEDITKAFKKDPWCMLISDDKLIAVMDFYVNRLGLDSSVIANCPTVLKYSLKKRLIPRGAVIEYLLSKGLVKFNVSIATLFISTESRFLDKYVKCHEEAPHLIKLYNQKLKLSDTKESEEDEE